MSLKYPNYYHMSSLRPLRLRGEKINRKVAEGAENARRTDNGKTFQIVKFIQANFPAKKPCG